MTRNSEGETNVAEAAQNDIAGLSQNELENAGTNILLQTFENIMKEDAQTNGQDKIVSTNWCQMAEEEAANSTDSEVRDDDSSRTDDNLE